MSNTLSVIVARGEDERRQPALHVGLAGDAPRTPPLRISLAGIDLVEIGRGDARRIERRGRDGRELVVTLADPRMSGKHTRLAPLAGQWFAEDRGSKNGTWLARERITRQRLADGDTLVLGHTAIVFRDSGGELGDHDGLPPALAPGLTTLSAALAAGFAQLERAARVTVPVEITGESGTGKELAARAVHTLSGRTGRFVAVNCGALPATLLEAELFGHKKGAYTGASEERAGLVRAADGGTLFLDEVAELPPTSQAALLRVLQESEVVPVGSDRPIKVDLRIVTATHRALDGEVAAGKFRADLRARMLGVQLQLPALRERREDLGHLIAALLARHAERRAITFSADAVAALYAYRWPLNIRELERALVAALAVADDRIGLEHIPAALRDRAAPRADAEQGLEEDEAVDLDALSDADRALRAALIEAIGRHDGNLAAVARELGKDRTQIRRWMKRLGLDRGGT